MERIYEFTNIKSENQFTKITKTNEILGDWPLRGEIQCKNVSLIYNNNDQMILKNVSLKISGKEKIGIVGRTGAGKSSIIYALSRLIQIDGCIEIDDIDVNSISIEMLRKNLTIIPQNCKLFSGTIRDNLDPFNEHTDHELWDTIREV